MKMKYLRSAALAVVLPNPAVHAASSNLRQGKKHKEYRVFDPKAEKRDYGVWPLDAKSSKSHISGKSTRSSCGTFWHRGLSSRNPNSCTNDDTLLRDDPSKLYLTVEGKKSFTSSFLNKFNLNVNSVFTQRVPL